MTKQQRLIVIVAGALLAALFPATAAQAAPRCFGRIATIVGTGGNDKLVGTRGPDVIVGRGGTDHIYGRGGRDRICGGSGEDRLYGGGGHDRVHAGLGDESGRGSWLYGGRGNDRLLGSRFGDGERIYGGPGNDLLRAFDCYDIYTDELFGGPGDDVLQQEAGDAWLAPGLGDDEVDGGSHERGDGHRSPDRTRDHLDLSDAPGPLHVDLGAGTVSGQGNDRVDNVEVVLGGAFDDRLIGGGSFTVPETFYGMAGSDILAGGGGIDNLFGEGAEEWHRVMSPPFLGGEPGNDTLMGGGGDDSLRGTAGDDVYVGGDGDDTASFYRSDAAVAVDLGAGTATGEGNDELRGIENVTGTNFADTLTGDEGDNFLYGGIGTDNYDGAGGNDTLQGSMAGGEHLAGGTGSDTVRYECDGRQQSPLEVDLMTGTDSTGNTLAGIENVWSGCRGEVSGDDGPNRLFVPGVLNGRGGDDVLEGSSTDDTLNGGDGNDVLDGAGGTDVCTEGETLVRCEA